MSLPPVEATHIARPFEILTSNVPGDYPPDQWADIIVPKIITMDEDIGEERRRQVSRFIAIVREILINTFSNVQEGELYLLADLGPDRYDADLGIDWHVNDAVNKIIAAAHEHLVFGSIDVGAFYDQVRANLCNIVGTNLATSVTITRRWHAHSREDDPRARKFLALH